MILDMKQFEMLKQQRDELLTALRNLVHLAETAMREANNDGASYEYDEELAEARAAIANASK